MSLRIAHRNLRIVLDTLHPGFVEAAPEALPLPNLAPLREAGISTEDPDAAFAADDVREERRILLGYVHESRFRWSDVDPTAPSTTRS